MNRESKSMSAASTAKWSFTALYYLLLGAIAIRVIFRATAGKWGVSIAVALGWFLLVIAVGVMDL